MAKQQALYAPSWVDRLLDWVDSLPIPAWVFYLLVYFLAALALHISNWLNGVAAWGVLSPVQLISAVWLPLVFFAIHTTDKLAAEAMQRFAPLARNKPAQLASLTYRITTMPAVLAAILYIVPLVVVGRLAMVDTSMVVYEAVPGPIHPVAWAINFVLSVTSYSMAPLLVYHALRQLYLITEAFDLADEVNVFHQQPLYAFSGLTMRTALFFLAMVYITYVSNLLYDASSTEDALNFTLSVVIAPASLLIVLVPLLGIHKRLLNAKADVLAKNSQQIEKAQQRLYQAIDKNKADNIKSADAAITSLYRVQEQLKAVPTWPWATGSFRNFLSAILIPMMLWLLQTLASRFL